MPCPPGAVGERCRLENYTTGRAAPHPVFALDEVCVGPYLGANTNPLDAPSKVEGGPSVHPASQPPLWRYAAKMQETPASAFDFVPAEARPQASAICVRERSGSPTLSYSPAQPVPTCQRLSRQTQGKRSREEVKTQLPTRAPQGSLHPDATHGTFGMLNGLREDCRFIIPSIGPSLGHASLAEGSLTGLAARPQIALFQGERLHRTREIVLKDDRGTRGSCNEIRSLTSTHARLEQSTRCAPAADATSFPTHSHLTHHSAKGKRSSSGVQRTERSRRGRDAGTLFYLRRKEHASHDGNLETLQERCREQGGDDEVIKHLSVIFQEGVNAKALSRKITGEEIANQVFGSSTEPRQVYWALLGQQVKDGFIRYTCRLCPEKKRYPYKNGKDVIPHIRKCHIGVEGETGKFG